MSSPSDMTPGLPSLRGIRVVAAVGAVVAVALVLIGFFYGLVYGLVALFVFPVIPLGFVLAFEGLRRTDD